MNTRALFFLLVMATFVLSGVAAAAWTAARSLRRRRRSVGEGAEPRCGRCGYIVHPGSRRICPECGADYAAIGVFTRSSAPPDFPLLLVWFWAVVLAGIAWLAAAPLARLVPWGWNFRAVHLVETSRANRVTGNSGVFATTVTGWGRWRTHRIDYFKVTYMTPGKRYVVMDVNPRDSTCRVFADGKPNGPRPLEPGAVRWFVECAEFEPGSEEGARLATELHDAIRRMLRHEFPQRVSTGSTLYSANEKAAWFAGGAVWSVGMFLVLLVAGRWYSRRKALAARRAGRLLEDLRLAA